MSVNAWGRTVMTVMGVGALAIGLPTPASAKEFYVGEPVTRNAIQLVPHYLLGIEMDGAHDHAGAGRAAAAGGPAGAAPIHLELDVHAEKGETHGFSEDMWIPNLTIEYTLEKVGTPFRQTGRLVAMTAGDGPHYANNVPFDGDGEYRVSYRLLPPSSTGFMRHVDKETGVPAWWEPFTVAWTFRYPSKVAEK